MGTGSSDEMSVEVAVVGGGLAGLRAADRLVGAGHDVVVLEARDRVGGRSELTHLRDGTPVDLGGMWLGPTQGAALELAEQLGLATFPQHTAGRSLLRLGGRWREVRLGRGSLPRLPAGTLLRLARGLAALDRLAATIPTDRPWDAPDAQRLDRTPFSSWLDDQAGTSQARALWELFVRTVFAAEPDELSTLHVAFYVASGDDVETLLSAEGGAQDRRIVGGTWQLAAGLAQRLGDRVRLRHVVRAVRHTADEVRLEVDTPEGRRSAVAARAVLAVPPTLAGQLGYDPPLPAARAQLTQQVPMGAVIKLFAAYPTPFWRETGRSGDVLDPDGIVSYVVDASPPTGTPGLLCGFVEGDHARQLSERDEAERDAVFVEALQAAFGPRAARPTEVVARDWIREPYSGGCYGGHLGVGAWTRFGPSLRRPIGALHFAGTETASRWAGYLDGALRSGDRVAVEVHRALTDRAAR